MAGVSSKTKENVIFGDGAVYLGYLNADCPGTLLGAVKAGSSFKVDQKIKSMEPDGALGNVKELEWVESESAVIKAEILELTEENLRMLFPGATISSGKTAITAEAVGTGDGTTTEFSLDHSNVVYGSVVVDVDGVEKTRGTDYTVDYIDGKIQFVTAPASTKAITADYSYISGDVVITGGDIDADSYLDNVAIVGHRLSDLKAVICVAENCLCDSSPELSMSSKEESSVKVEFTARYLSTALTTRPWKIQYINTEET